MEPQPITMSARLLNTQPLMTVSSHGLHSLIAQILTEWAPTTRHSAGRRGCERRQSLPTELCGIPHSSKQSSGRLYKAVVSSSGSSDKVPANQFLYPEQLLLRIWFSRLSQLNKWFSAWVDWSKLLSIPFLFLKWVPKSLFHFLLMPQKLT